MLHTLISRFAALFISLLLAGGAAQAAQTSVMDEKDILPYLESMISWHRTAATLDTSPEIPRELILKTQLLQHTAQALDGSFAFARATAETLPPAPKPPDVVQETLDKSSRKITLNRAIILAGKHIEQLQSNLKQARAGKLRDNLTGELRLEREHLALLREIAETIGVPGIDDDSLPHKIDQLAGTVAKVDSPQSPAAASANGAPSASGIVGLATKVYFFYQARGAVKTLLNETTSLARDNSARSQAIRATVQDIMQQGRNLADKPPEKSPPAGAARTPAAKTPQAVTAAVKAVAAAVQSAAAIAKPAVTAPPPTYDDLILQMKKLSGVAIALSQTNKALKLCTGDLSDWVDLISAHINGLMANLVFRLWMLALAIGVAFGLAALARKATRRYVHDHRRKNQLRVIRKVTLAVTIALILFLGFFTDLNSLATFAGLATAGIAFATKDMILSVIAYFQFFSSSDIRPGDSITIAGVTGRITSIGMLRFYMMEMERSDAGYLPTGRVVGFANNILFQPTPFFRQTPGTDFVWNEINVSLAPNIDHTVAYKKLNDLLQTIYARHQGLIRNSEAALQKFAPFKLDVAVPQTHFKFTNMGIVFVIRYAVERDMAQAIHLEIAHELIAAARKDPDLKIQHIS